MSARWRAVLPWLAVTAGAGLCVAAVVAWYTVADPHGDVDALPWLLVFLASAGNVALGDAFIRRHREWRRAVADRDAEIGRLNGRVMHLSAQVEALSALPDRQPRVAEFAPDPVWADIVRRLGDSS